jgi:hypothetical protein
MNFFETYIRDLRDIHLSGAAVPETSYYGVLSNLLTEIGKSLKPKVSCIINIQNKGAGIPDAGLFDQSQFQKSSDVEPLKGTLPARGVVEIKSTKEDVVKVAATAQITKYLNKYGQVLVTNYRDFLLVGRDALGNKINLESYKLSDSEVEFWQGAMNPDALAKKHSERFIEYIKRVMMMSVPLTSPEDVAWFLASYARDAKARIESVELTALTQLRTALEEALGLKFEGEKGERFFRSTLVQTLFYGIFSAWVLWHKENKATTSTKFNWQQAVWLLRVPMLRALFEQIVMPSKLKPLGLVEVLDWTDTVLNRVVPDEFFAKFQEGQAVQYFYEPFLQAFDPELRKELGVWYTPHEIVEYMVARIDRVLREELDIADGFADPTVYVLDPCCGTGTYLVEVLKRIAQTLREQGEDALVSHHLKQAAMKRVFGFEILPAPFVVAHLQLGLILQNEGAPLIDDAQERVGVYLTNALTGWESQSQIPISWIELEQERKSSGLVKQKQPILVVLGNPPYNAFAGVSPGEEEGLVEVYKGVYYIQRPPKKTAKGDKFLPPIKRYKLSDPQSQGGWGIKKYNLDELYVRFLRLAERRIAEISDKGIVCYITNFSYLSDSSFVIMRQKFLSEFDALWFDCLTGDSRETGKLTPEGKPDPSVFSSEYNRVGIRKGTAIGLMIRRPKRSNKPMIRFRHFWGVTKRADLIASLNTEDFNSQYDEPKPDKINRFSFRPSEVGGNYLSWAKLSDFSSSGLQGMDEDRANALINIKADELTKILSNYFDPKVEWADFASLKTGLSRNSAAFNPQKVRGEAQKKEIFDTSRIHRYLFRPYDIRWAYYTDVPNVWKRCRPELYKQNWQGNAFLLSRVAGVASPEGVPFLFTINLLSRDSMKGHAVAFPLQLRPLKDNKQATAQISFLPESEVKTIANLSQPARDYLESLGLKNPDEDNETASLIWMHSLAIGYSPSYLLENADGIRQDFPRIPLPSTKAALVDSSELGKKIAALLNTESQVVGVTSSPIRSELKTVGVFSRVSNTTLTDEDFQVTADWGHAGKNGVTMPGKGKYLEREYTDSEHEAIKQGVLSFDEALRHLGEQTIDVYLNGTTYWRNIPLRVWEYNICGYQVIKKWLSYREFDLLKRALTIEEVQEVMQMARRIAAILLLEPTLNTNYQVIKEKSYTWKV